MNFRDEKIDLSLAAAATALFLCCSWPYASIAQNINLPDGPIACTDFHRGANGSWTVVHPTTIHPRGVEMKLAPGQTFAENQFVDGVEVTTVLDRNCGNK
jgi:hypothetical protein